MRLGHYRRIAVSVLAAGAVAACGPINTRLTTAEKRIGTANRGDWLLHRLPEEPFGLGLAVPGYIIGFEKTHRVAKLDLPKLTQCETVGDCSSQWARYGVRRTTNVDGLDRYSDACRDLLLDRRNRNVAGWLSDSEQAFLSHIVRYSYRSDRGMGAIWPRFVYNAYAGDQSCREGMKCNELFERGRKLLDGGSTFRDYDSSKQDRTLRQEIEEDVQEATHVLLYTMGWNTDQEEAIRNFNSLIGELLDEVARREVRDGEPSGFRPLVIGVTWDSLAGNGITRPLSYPSKANDADEVGTVWISRLIWNVLAPLKQDYDFALVLLGHSFGARALLQGLHARPHLPESRVDADPVVDLALMYQGAVSANRFLPKQGQEGAPWAGYAKVAHRIALTWSTEDTANPKAKIFTKAKHIGGKPGFERAAENCDVFDLRTWNGAELESPPKGCRSPRVGSVRECAPTGLNQDDKILMIDASKVIHLETHRKGGKAHSDIYNEEVAALTWHLLREYTRPWS